MSKNNKEKKTIKYELPYAQIKKDIFKTAMFALFSVWLLLAMFLSGVNYDDLLNFLSRFKQ
ncbi:MAG: hypothetical protein UU77_C0015G0004 [candidate division WWE3 bacterium GW2011_GWC1_41_7]|jgi:hypothetical protein|uniref:Uncharacterized protein n=2 Tax=Katanobacteria TaxID=422282 RepID=A0A0G0X6W2_UNCKA|nr:MAG: hypothetical protein UU77_C0015G0004 [candidate division WWE3 bacterium GW2011_GWC1_41_7]OGC58337.1 MAG: hypothetical protein A2976_03230 [candidate division WWE3 bacterium RIFCSPLOWO2_01_FULL_41_9]